MRTVFAGHDWGSPVFRDLANGLSVWFTFGAGVLFFPDWKWFRYPYWCISFDPLAG